MAYEFSRIEKKWQNYWLENKTYKAVTGDKTRKKFYPLIEFPVSLWRRTARRPPEAVYSDGHRRQETPYAGRERAVPDRLRRLRPAD